MLSRHANSLFYPSPLMHGFLTAADLGSSRGTTIEPSYRYESDSKHAMLEVELPGVCRDDITVDVNNHHLTVSAKRAKTTLLGRSAGKEDGNGKREKTEKMGETNDESGGSGGDDRLDAGSGRGDERFVTYSLNIRIGQDADVGNISCVSYKDGVLLLEIPSVTKKESSRRIAIH